MIIPEDPDPLHIPYSFYLEEWENCERNFQRDKIQTSQQDFFSPSQGPRFQTNWLMNSNKAYHLTFLLYKKNKPCIFSPIKINKLVATHCTTHTTGLNKEREKYQLTFTSKFIPFFLNKYNSIVISLFGLGIKKRKDWNNISFLFSSILHA